MSIRDVEAREKQERQRNARREREAEARPDALHRAVVFLLRASKENNPDLSVEADHHIKTLDLELANLEAVAELEKTPATATAEDAGSAAAPPADAPPPNTAKALQQSKRFRRNS